MSLLSETTPLLPTSVDNRPRGRSERLPEAFRHIHGLWSRMTQQLEGVENPAAKVLIKTLGCSQTNWLLPLVVISIVVCHFGNPPDVLKFALNFFAIVPLAAVLSFATEELAERWGRKWGGLVNATFGNAVEAVVSLVALSKGQIDLVQQSMLGSILSNILFVLGCCFYFAGRSNPESTFDPTRAINMYSHLLVACAAIILPAILAVCISPGSSILADTLPDSTLSKVLTVSRYSSVVLIILYANYTYDSLSDDQPANADKSSDAALEEAVQPAIAEYSPEVDGFNAVDSYGYPEPEFIQVRDEAEVQEEEEHLSAISCFIVLTAATAAISVLADYLVDSIEGVVETGICSKMFIGLILIPIVGNAAEHVGACFVAVKGDMDLAIEIALGSSIQIALGVTPFLVLCGYLFSQDMTLRFPMFGTVVLFLSVIAVGSMVQDGKSNILEGRMCLALYAVVAIACLAYPDDLSAGAASVASIVTSSL